MQEGQVQEPWEAGVSAAGTQSQRQKVRRGKPGDRQARSPRALVPCLGACKGQGALPGVISEQKGTGEDENPDPALPLLAGTLG